MESHRELRTRFKKDVMRGGCRCILSGLPIISLNDLSIEHFYPRSLLSYEMAGLPDNLYPALKVINGIKSDILPCEFFYNREDILKHALKKGHFKKKDEEIVKAAIKNIPYYNIDPCLFCILNNECNNSR